MKFHQMKTHALLRDIANTDYTIEKLRELAPAALVGEQNFFVAYGLHKVHCYILIIPVLFLMILFFVMALFSSLISRGIVRLNSMIFTQRK